MKFQVLGLFSDLMGEDTIRRIGEEFIEEIESGTAIPMEWVNSPGDFSRDAIPLVFIQTGGTEGKFLAQLDKLPQPTFLLTHGAMNSLAASLEILSYLRQHDLEGEVIHGEMDYIQQRLVNIQKIKRARLDLSKARLGVIGKPSDWLIASQVEAAAAEDKLGLEIVEFPIEKLIELSQKEYEFDDPLVEVLKHKKFSPKELTKALNIYGALYQLKEDYHLSGLTVRCFDLLEPLQSTGCIGLALLNARGIPSACEGDVPALISMMILHYLVGEPGFMVNPSQINIFDNSMVVAHCTLPINMGTDYQLNTHFESGIGVALDGYLPEQQAMMFKVDANLKRYFLSEIEILKNLSKPNLCRTQIEIKLAENVEYFLTEPCGNHHIITLKVDIPLVGDFMKSIQ
jgi:L-fucose isomerase-like protein